MFSIRSGANPAELLHSQTHQNIHHLPTSIFIPSHPTQKTSIMYSSAILVLFLWAVSFLPTWSKPFESTEPLPVEVLYQFPVGTWVEAMRPRHNGKILTTSLTSPDLVEVGKRFTLLNVIHTFGNKTSCTGMHEWWSPNGLHEVYFVITGNMDLTPFSFGPVPGSWSVYRVKLREHRHRSGGPPHVSLVADFPASIMLNGITGLFDKHQNMLVGDSGAGIVYRLHRKSGKVFRVLDDPLMKPKKPDGGSFGIGINKMLVDDGYLYFTNADQGIFARIAIHEDGTSKGSAAEVMYQLDSPASFTWDEDDMVFAQHRFNRLVRAADKTHIMTRLAPNVTDKESELVGPTAMAWLPGTKRLLIGTNGGTAQYLTGEYTRGGTISLVSLEDQ